jgi:hypothetical protein
MGVLAGEGTTIGYGATSGGTFTVVAQVLSIKPPGGEVTAVPTTTLTSAVKTARAGLIPDIPEVTFKIQYDPNDATHQALAGLLVSGAQATPKWWEVTYVSDPFTTSAKDVFQAILTKFEPSELEGEGETNLEADITLKPISVVTRTPGSSGP